MTLQTVMEGHAFYNNNSLSQHAVDVQAIPSLIEAAETVSIPAEGPIVIGDYGCSQGRNSLEPVGAVIDALRRRAENPIAVCHIDLPSNDFSALFDTLRSSGHTYLRDGVFPSACGRSFYEAVLPPHQLVLGWCACAVHWLNGSPCAIPGHVWPHAVGEEARAAWQEQAARDYRLFLALRARELRLGGQLVVCAGMRDANGFVGPERGLDALNDAAREMVSEGVMREAEYERIVIPAYFRSHEEYHAPFADGFRAETGERLEILDAVELAVPTPLLDRYRVDHDAIAYGLHQAGFIRGWSGAIVRQHLDADRTPEQSGTLVENLYGRMAARFALNPEEWEPHWQQIVMRIARTE